MADSMARRSSNDEIDISLQSDFNIFISRSVLYLWNMKDYKIHFQKAEKVATLKEFEKFKDHMRHLHKDIFSSTPKASRALKSSFADTIHFYNTTQPKKKLFCRIEGNYLVKKYFTEGVQYVDEGEIHSYKVIGKALDIYTSNTPLELKSIHVHYDKCMKAERILNGETKIIHPNTYYIIIAPCHTFLKKIKFNASELGNSTEIVTSIDNEADQLVYAPEDRNGLPLDEQLSVLPGSSEITDDVHDNSMHSIKNQGVNETQTVKSRYIKSNDRPSKRVKFSASLPSTSQMADTSMSPLPITSNSQMARTSVSPLPITSNSQMARTSVSPLPITTSNSQMARTSMSPLPIASTSQLTHTSMSPLPMTSNSQKTRTSVSPLPRASTSQMAGTSVSPSPNSVRDTLAYDSDIRPGDSYRVTKPMTVNSPLARSSISSAETSLEPSSPSTLRDEVERICTMDNHSRAVFAIRKEDSIESYSLRPGSTFRVLADNIMTGSFVIENDDMDPSIIEYHGDVQYIREIAKFKNGSMFETTLPVQKDLLNELQDLSKKREKVVVNYFFESTFKAIESAYEKFSKLRNTKMIGSCVPAIVSLSNAKFCGVVSDTYEAKPY